MVKELDEIFKSKEAAKLPQRLTDFRKLTAVYRCTAAEDEEQTCKRFIPGITGTCCFAVNDFGMRTCINQEVV